MGRDFPESYKDTAYASLDAKTEQKLGLPSGLLSNIRERGERSNHSQVSEAAASGVYQFIPSTRKAILDKYGIDVTLSPENASEGAGLLLKEGLKRNGGDPAQAVGEYIAGINRKNWGPTTRSYINRVMTGMRPSASEVPAAPAARPTGGSTFDRVMATMRQQGVGGPQIAAVFNAYQSGQMSPEDAAEFEADVNSGAVMLPRGASLKSPAAPSAQQAPAQALPSGVEAAYFSGQMAPEDRAQLEADVAAGLVAAPKRVEIPPALPPGMQAPAATNPIIPDTPTTLGEKAVGALETGATAVTGATSGILGGAGGILGAGAASILNGKWGTPEANAMIEQSMREGQQSMTYMPKTLSGQQQTQALGEIAQQAAPLTGLAGPLAQVGQNLRTAAQAPRVAAATAAARAAESVPAPIAQAGRATAAAVERGAEGTKQALTAALDKVRAATGAGPEPRPTLGTGGSAGAAGTDVATMRRATADNLPVRIDLTTGQATRDHGLLQFEGETAKDARVGGPLRERAAEQNKQLAQNFEAMIDDVGATAPDHLEAGRVLVDKTLVPAAARLKNEYRAKYRAADKAGETTAAVDLQPLADYLNENRAGRTSAPILNTIADELGVKGVGKGDLADGSIVGGQATLKQAEEIRKAVNKFVKDTDPNDLRVGSEIKAVIDKITDGKGGELYQDARRARQRYAQLFEDNTAVSQLLKTRRGTSDRQVALENVFAKTVLSGDRESLGKLRRTLDISDQKAGYQPGTDGPGAQAWREMKGSTLRHLLEESTKGSATDVAGNTIFSADKLNQAVRAMDKGDKLDFVLGKKTAQTVRDISEIAKYVKTFPPGSVNHSNTSSALLAALAEAGTTGALTGLPVPVVSVLKAATSHIADRKLAARVRESLGTNTAATKATAKF